MMSGADFNGIKALHSRVLMDVKALGEHQMMSGEGFNGIKALHSRVLMDVKALGE